MNKDERNPIEQLTDHIAALTLQLLDMERERDEARKGSDEWYHNWQRKDAELKETQAKLDAEIEAHKDTQQALQDALKTATEKGAQHNG